MTHQLPHWRLGYQMTRVEVLWKRIMDRVPERMRPGYDVLVRAIAEAVVEDAEAYKPSPKFDGPYA
jgi:hypothetical protein